MNWHIFCKVIDNHGDLGVCWRLACGLAAQRQTVSLWVDDPSALSWMAPEGHPAVTVLTWQSDRTKVELARSGPVDVLIEAFGCEPAPEVVSLLACSVRGDAGSRLGRRWINLEYLSAEPGVERLHGLASPVFAGAGAGLTKHFFYPGFTRATGGLLREQGLAQQMTRFELAGPSGRSAGRSDLQQNVTLFCYEPHALTELLDQWATSLPPVRLLVTAGRASDAVRQVLRVKDDVRATRGARKGCLEIEFLDLMTQSDFDRLLWRSSLNFVRGEDSLVRALWAGEPLVWQIYPQDDHAHHHKLTAFLDWLEAPLSLRRFHLVWNGVQDGPLPTIDAEMLDTWRAAIQSARARLWAQDDLVTQLRGFVAQKS